MTFTGFTGYFAWPRTAAGMAAASPLAAMARSTARRFSWWFLLFAMFHLLSVEIPENSGSA